MSSYILLSIVIFHFKFSILTMITTLNGLSNYLDIKAE